RPIFWKAVILVPIAGKTNSRRRKRPGKSANVWVIRTVWHDRCGDWLCCITGIWKASNLASSLLGSFYKLAISKGQPTPRGPWVIGHGKAEILRQRGAITNRLAQHARKSEMAVACGK